jgi:cation transport regulator
MPYQKKRELPKSVRDTLPAGAQGIFRKAYNNAWDVYRERETRRGNASREETAHRVAWAAVKMSYRKRGERWVRKSD